MATITKTQLAVSIPALFISTVSVVVLSFFAFWQEAEPTVNLSLLWWLAVLSLVVAYFPLRPFSMLNRSKTKATS